MPTIAPDEVKSIPLHQSVALPQPFFSKIRFQIEKALRNLTRRYVNSFVFFEADLSGLKLDDAPSRGVEPVLFRGVGDVGTVCRLLGPLGAEPHEVETRMLRGDVVSIGFVRDKPVAYTWITFADAEVPELGLRLLLQPGEAVQYDTFVAPQWRGHGFQFPLNVPPLKHARERGYKKTLAWVHVLNTRSFKNQVRSGKKVVQTAVSLRLPGVSRRFVVRLPGKLRNRLTSLKSEGASL